jgi:2-oxopent-4-enoate/cis-2-oxohex-4-enoate hydratase
MNPEAIAQYGSELYQALRTRQTVLPLTSREPDIMIDDAYQISLKLLEQRLASGEKIVGKKIGVTSKAVQTMLDVHQPDFGFLTDKMAFEDACEMPIGRELIQPRAEAEIAFVLKSDLVGPGIDEAAVIAATERVHACFEVVDSRIRDWKIRIQDTVADNASSGLFLLGKDGVDPRKVDLVSCRMVVHKNGAKKSEGTGKEALGSPVYCVAWLANTLGRFGISLRAGEVILSGSLVPLEPVVPGDEMSVSVEGIGGASVRFV